MKNVLSRDARRLATAGATVMLLSAAAALAQVSPQVNAEHVALLQAQSDWTHTVVSRVESRGQTVSGDLIRELQAIDGQLARLDRIARQKVEG